jgi:ABC-type transport system substrate-binding protein
MQGRRARSRGRNTRAMRGRASGPAMTRRSFLTAAGLTVGAIGTGALAAACAPGTAAPSATNLVPQRGGTLTYGAGADIVTLDPANIGDAVSANSARMIFEGLTRQLPNLDYGPALATSWESSGTTWTFKLRQGVKFHDGTPFDADSVKFVFDRILGPEATLRKGTWAAIVSKVEVVDPSTVRFTTKYVDPFFHTRVGDGSTASVFSPESFRKFGKDIAKNPVGTGPFKFVEWVKDDHLTVAGFADYWGGAPYLDKVTVRPLPEAETRVIGLEAGDIQLAIRLNPEHISRLEGNKALKLIKNETTRHYYTGIANLKKPFSDIKVRQALNHAIDKDSLVKNILAGLGTVQGGLLPKGAASYVDTPGFKYDPAKAKQLLAEAGYPHGFSATFVGTKGVYLKDFEIEQAMQEMWKAVGVNITLNIVENAKYLEFLRADPRTSTLEMWWDTFAGAGAGSADYILQRFGCANFRPVGTNTAGACFPDIDKISDQAVVELDATKRNALLKTVQEQLSVQAPAVWLFSIQQITGSSAKLHDPALVNEALYVDAKTWLEK